MPWRTIVSGALALGIALGPSVAGACAVLCGDGMPHSGERADAASGGHHHNHAAGASLTIGPPDGGCCDHGRASAAPATALRSVAAGNRSKVAAAQPPSPRYGLWPVVRTDGVRQDRGPPDRTRSAPRVLRI